MSKLSKSTLIYIISAVSLVILTAMYLTIRNHAPNSTVISGTTTTDILMIPNTESAMTDQKIEYNGREIVIPQEYASLGNDSAVRSLSAESTENSFVIFLDGEKLNGTMVSSGKFVLQEYAYDPQESVEDLAKKYVDYLDKQEKVRLEARKEKSQ